MSSIEIEIDEDERVGHDPIVPGEPSVENVLFVLLGVVGMLGVILRLFLLFS